MAFWASFKLKVRNFFSSNPENEKNKTLLIEGEEVNEFSDLRSTVPTEEFNPMQESLHEEQSKTSEAEEVEEENSDDEMLTSEQEIEKETDKYTKQRAILIKPRYSREAKIIAQRLMENNIVILNLEEVTKVDFERIRDFVSGTLFSLKGDYRKVSKNIAVLLPSQKVDEDYLALVVKKVHQLIEKNRKQ